MGRCLLLVIVFTHYYSTCYFCYVHYILVTVFTLFAMLYAQQKIANSGYIYLLCFVTQEQTFGESGNFKLAVCIASYFGRIFASL